MIKKYISEIHGKSEEHRKKVAYGTSAVITALIGLVWFTSFGLNSLNSTSNTIANNTTNSYVVTTSDTANNNTDNGPLSLLGTNISNAYNAFKSAIGVKNSNENLNKNATPTLQYVPEE